MPHDNEVKAVARVLAAALAPKELRRTPQLAQYVDNMWPAYTEAAEDAVIFLLGDEYQLDEVVNHETDGNGATPFVVCSRPGCTGEC